MDGKITIRRYVTETVTSPKGSAAFVRVENTQQKEHNDRSMLVQKTTERKPSLSPKGVEITVRGLESRG